MTCRHTARARRPANDNRQTNPVRRRWRPSRTAGVHKLFYDRIYAHDWLKQFFAEHNQQAIENRQTSFMAEKMGGPVEYWGKEMKMAHQSMYITAELFELRHALLEESLREAGVPEDLRRRWLRIDNAFRKNIVKDSIASFYSVTWKYKKRTIVPKPAADK